MTIAITGPALGQDQLTEREVVAAARSIEQLRALRQTSGHDKTGALGIATTTFALTTDEVDACLALLIERHTGFIASLGIVPDRQAA